MIIVTCRIYPKDTGILYKEETWCFKNTRDFKDFLVNKGNVIVDKVFEIKDEENNND